MLFIFGRVLDEYAASCVFLYLCHHNFLQAVGTFSLLFQIPRTRINVRIKYVFAFCFRVLPLTFQAAVTELS